MVQAAHDARVFSRAADKDSGAKASAPSKLPCWKLRVGRACRRLNTSKLPAVPSSRYLAVAGPNERADNCLARAASS